MSASRNHRGGLPVDLILNPADDYVRKFTNDVPWELILTAGDVASDATPPTDIKEVTSTTKISSLLPYLADHDHGVAVRSNDGVLTHLTSRDVIVALASGVVESIESED